MFMCLSAGIAAFFTMEELSQEEHSKIEIALLGVLWGFTLIGYIFGI